MNNFAKILQKLAAGEFEFTRHALKRAVERNISDGEIREVGAAGELIEEYPDDKYSPSILLLGFTTGGRPIHLQISLALTEKAKIITLYEPDPGEWVKFRKRR